MKLLKILKQKPFCNDLHYFLFSIILLMLGLKYYPLLIIFFIYLFYIYKKTKLLLYISVLSLIIIAHISILKIIRDNNKSKKYNGYVLDVIDENNYIFQSGIIKIKLYDYNHNLKPGDVLNIEVALNKESKSYENDFDYEEYLYSKNISYYGKTTKKEYIKSGFSIYSLKYYYSNYLKNNLSLESYSYVMAMVFGDNILESNIKDAYSTIGISHILAISGLHIIFLFNILSFILLKLFHYYKSFIPLLIITIYIIIIGAPTSSIRALLFLIIGSLNTKGNIYYTKLDILSISFILMLLFNPYYFYSTGFILSYIVSFILIFIPEIIKENDKIKRIFKSYFLIFFGTLPFVIKISGAISYFSIIIAPILSLISYIILPITYLLAIFPILDIIFKYFFIFINIYIEGISNIIPLLHIKTMDIYFILLYYLIYGFILYLLASNKKPYKGIIILLSYLSIFILFKFINPIASVTFIDCGQGDSALIRLPFNQGVVLVDAYNSYSYLKSEGIDRIDYLVLTHSDDDHIGDYKKIIDKIDVKMIIYPKYDDRFNDLLKSYNNIKKVNNNININLYNTKMEILGPINPYDDTNSNSIVFKININNKIFLFTGDMTLEEEKDLIKYYGKKLDADILKVGHHGSKTSTSDLFLKYVTPSYSVISVGNNNKYGLPDLEIVNKLKKVSKIYMTKDCGNITFNLLNDYMYTTTYRKMLS